MKRALLFVLCLLLTASCRTRPYAESDQYKGAIRKLATAIPEPPLSEAAIDSIEEQRINHLLTQTQQGNPDEAERTLREYIRENHRADRLERAKKALQSLMEKRWCRDYNEKWKSFNIKPGTPQARDEMYKWYNAKWVGGRGALEKKNFPQAIEKLTAAVADGEVLYGIDGPKLGDVLADLGHAYYKNGDTHKALETYDRAYPLMKEFMFKMYPNLAAEHLVIYEKLLRRADRRRDAGNIMAVYVNLTGSYLIIDSCRS